MYLFCYWVNKLFSEENKVPRTLLEARKVAGSATYKVSEYEAVLSFKLRLFVQLFSHEHKDSLFVCLDQKKKKKSVYFWLKFLPKMS